ncbi:MAG: hypothetical protein ABSG02_04955 [Terriglobales bacterium]
MKIALHLLCPLVMFIWLACSIAQVGNYSGNRDALLGEVAGHVKILAFNTDKPVHYLRLVIDGKEVASDRFGSTGNGVKLAVITPAQSAKLVEVYYEISNMGGYMTGAFRPLQEDNVGQSEYFGPGKDVVLNGWTQIYGYSQHYMGNTKALYDLRFEIKN